MSNRQDFSPVKLPRSPGLNYVGNLTGYPRKVKDSAADCFNWYLKWKQQSIDGIAVLNNISSQLVKRNSSKESEGYSFELERLCGMLQDIINELEGILEKMNILCDQSRAMVDLVKLDEHYTGPWFLSWPPERFYKTYQMFKSCLEDELRMKKRVCETVCHVSSHDTVMFLIASWKYAPYMHPKFETRMDALLMETGHKPY